MKNKILQSSLKALDSDLSRLPDEAIQTIYKRFKGDYKAIKREIDKLYRKYEREGVFLYDNFVYDKEDVKLQMDIAKRTLKTYAVVEKTIDKLLNKSVDKVIKGVSDIKVLQTVPYRGDTASIVNEKIQGFNWAERLGRDRVKTIQKVSNIVDESLRKGRTMTQTTDKIAKELGVSINKATKIARTEQHRVINTIKEERFSSIKNKEGLMKKWVSAKDERVRSQHAEMDGEAVGLDEEFTLPDGTTTKAPGLSDNPNHDINCRCLMTLTLK